MTAPDRIWMLDNDVESCVDYRPTWNGETMGVEYIRKGAFPVEEIKREIARQKGLTYQGSREVFERILSLLESDDEVQ